jgi:hypothetical protein
MRQFLIVICAVFSMAAFAAAKNTISLADAAGKTGNAIQDPATMSSLVSSLAPSDQVAFLAKVNAAIDLLPGSMDVKTAKYLDVAIASLKSAAPGNGAKMVAEIFATVPVESLAVLNESLAAKLLNRSADPTRVYTDENFVKISKFLISEVFNRVKDLEDANVRTSIAVLMMARASNGSPKNLVGTLVEVIKDASVRERAKNEWIAPALVNNNYEPILAAANAGSKPDSALVLRLSRAQMGVAILGSLGGGDIVSSVLPDSSMYLPDDAEDASSGLNRMPGYFNQIP